MHQLDKKNLRIMKDEKGNHRLQIIMPNNTGNYLHSDDKFSVNDALLVRELLLEQEFTSNDVGILEDSEYYRVVLKIKDVNETEYMFHSRKLNLNDLIYEIDELIE